MLENKIINRYDIKNNNNNNNKIHGFVNIELFVFNWIIFVIIIMINDNLMTIVI
jgi:hypothetical protein